MNITTVPARHALRTPMPGLSGWEPPSSSTRNGLQVVARRIVARTGLPLGVVLAHAAAAGLGQEGR
jgi:hypothetical protein